MTDKPSKDELAAQVDTESSKRTARKAAQPEPEKAPELVSVVMLATTRGSKRGERREVPAETADRLVRQGHATRA